MRYGENPHQQAAFYREKAPAPGHHCRRQTATGQGLSYNNSADADAALECVKTLPTSPPASYVKHANPLRRRSG